jgi:hypothetical protein
MPHEKGLLHRLDKDTSGLVLIARTQRAFDSLLKQFSEDKVKKSYIAVSTVDSNPKNAPNDIFSMDWEDILKRTPAVVCIFQYCPCFAVLTCHHFLVIRQDNRLRSGSFQSRSGLDQSLGKQVRVEASLRSFLWMPSVSIKLKK